MANGSERFLTWYNVIFNFFIHMSFCIYDNKVLAHSTGTLKIPIRQCLESVPLLLPHSVTP